MTCVCTKRGRTNWKRVEKLACNSAKYDADLPRFTLTSELCAGHVYSREYSAISDLPTNCARAKPGEPNAAWNYVRNRKTNRLHAAKLRLQKRLNVGRSARLSVSKGAGVKSRKRKPTSGYVPQDFKRFEFEREKAFS